MKKALLTGLSIALVAVVAVFGTLAYYTDRGAAANVFTWGDVDIELNEDFTQGAQLIPGVDIEKEVTITNTGKNDAWVWTTIAIPAALDSDDASKNVLHFNYSKESLKDWTWTDADGKWMIKTETIDNIQYNVYTVLYKSTLAAGATTATSAMTKVYLDTHVDIDPNGDLYKVVDGTPTKIDWNVNDNGNPIMYVSAYAIQDEKFDSIADAWEAYGIQWGENGGASYDVPAVREVATADELADALAQGGVVVVNADIDVDANTPMTIASGVETTLNLNGHTIEGISTKAASTSVIDNKGTLIVDDSKGNGKIVAIDGVTDEDWEDLGFPTWATNTINNRGTMIVNGGTIENAIAKKGACYAIDNYAGSTLVVNDGEIIGKKVATRIFTASANSPIDVTINGGKMKGTRAIWIQLAGLSSAVAPKVNLTVNDGTLSSTDSEYNLAIYSYSYGNNLNNVTLDITGGTFNGNIALSGGTKNGKETVSISGATFNNGEAFYYTETGTESIQ